jgi:uncharacterized membrane protein
MTWRVIATSTNITLAYILTGSIEIGLKLGIIDVFLKTAVYYLHERAWYKSKWGVDIPK